MGFGKKLKKVNPVKNFVSAGERISKGDVAGAAKQTAYGLGKTVALAPTGFAGAIGLGSAAGADYLGDKVAAKNKAARDAQAKQQALADRAYGENAFSGAGYSDAQRNIMDNMVAGKQAEATPEEIATRMTSLVPQINQNFTNNAWSTARQKATNTAQLQAANDIASAKTALQTSALDKLREEATNRSNTLMGKASMVQAKPTWMDNASDLMGLTGSAAGTGAKVASLFV